jgi:uncharacterized membrane protein
MSKNIAILILILLACSLRLSHLGQRSMYTDENFTLLNANGIWPGGGNQTDFITKKYFTAKDFWQAKSVQDYFNAIAHSDFGTHIVYNSILHFWMQAFGNHDFSVRLLSVIFNILMIVAVFLLVLKIFNSMNSAFLAGLLLVFDPFNIAQSHIARSYTLSFLLIIIATYLFLEILKNKADYCKIALYAFIVGLCLLNHYLNFLVPLAHGLVFLFLKNKKHLWPAMIMAAVFNFLLMGWWFTNGGGNTALEFLIDKNQKHLQMAKEGTMNSVIQLTTPLIILKKSIELFFDSNLLTLKAYNTLNGLKPFFLSIALFIVLLTAHIFKERKKYTISIALFLGAVMFLTLFKSLAGAYMTVVFFYFVLYFLIIQNKEYYDQNARNQFALLSISFLMLLIPIIFVGYDAFKNGHATSLAKRYVGISAPFVAILMGIGTPLFLKKIRFSYIWVLIILVFQFPIVKNQIESYFNDNSEFAWFSPPRIANPNIAIAQKVQSLYAEGDTLVIPGGFKTIYDKTFGQELVKNFSDAQLINLYLPRNSNMVQTVNAAEVNIVYLKKKDGRRLELFNFENTKYRY